MRDETGLTPEQHLQAALDHIGKAARQLAREARQALEPVLGRLAVLSDDLQAQARVRRRAEEDVALACGCECARVHRGSWVCDLKAVTTIRSDPTGRVDVPVCAPCAAEVMAQQL